MRIKEGLKASHQQGNRMVNSCASSYTIYKDGSTYYAESNFPGGTDYYNASVNTLLQQICQQDNVDLYFKHGKYDFTGTWTIENPVTVRGAGTNMAASGNYVGGTELYFPGGSKCIEAKAPCNFRDFIIRSQLAGQTCKGLYLTAGSDYTRVLNVDTRSIQGGGVAVSGASYIEIFGGYHTNNDDDDVEIADGSYCTVIGVTTESSGVGQTRPSFWVTKNSDHNTFLACVAKGCYRGFGVLAGGGSSATDNVFQNCHARNNLDSGFYFGQLVSGTAYRTKVLGCVTIGNGAYGINIAHSDINDTEIRQTTFDNNVAGQISDSGTNTQIHFNQGYVTENRGSSTGTGAEQTIAHGLAGSLVPNNVVVVPTVTGATVSGVWADATNIYCTVTADKAYNWFASVS